MREFVHTYPYLVFCLVGLGLLGGLLMHCPGQRKPALWSGLLCVPFGLSGAWLVPVYWDPRLVWSIGRVGVEDLLFCFVTGGLVWLFSAWWWRDHLAVEIQMRFVSGAYAALLVLGLLCFGTAWLILRDPMAAVWMAFGNGTAVFLLLRPGSWRLAVAGAAGFGLYYGLSTMAWIWLVPEFADSWPAAGRWNAPVGGVPQGEIVWAVTFGACWPSWMAYLFRAEVMKEST